METHWFERIAAHAGKAYLRYSFTKGTEQEVAFLADVLGLQAGMALADVGCGPGRHVHALATAVPGLRIAGVDVSGPFVRLAVNGGARAVVRGDARRLPWATGSLDAVISLCQGGFGLVPGEDHDVVAEIARVLRPGGRLALSAFSSYFVCRYLLEDGESTFDADRSVNHERTEVRDETGRPETFDLWTTCFTPKELRLVCAGAGLEVEHVWAVTPGDYARRPPDTEHPEHLVVARKPA